MSACVAEEDGVVAAEVAVEARTGSCAPSSIGLRRGSGYDFWSF